MASVLWLHRRRCRMYPVSVHWHCAGKGLSALMHWSITTPWGPAPVVTLARTVIVAMSITETACPAASGVPWSAEATVASPGVRYTCTGWG